MTGRMLEEIEKVLQIEKPDIVLVYGDTNSTLAGALAAKKLNIQVAHVEAGLRSFNMDMPEEINRILTDRISDFLFCPTKTALKNLKKEGFEGFDNQVHLVGDVMFDAALFYEKQSDKISKIIQQLNIKKNEFILCTVHRQENTDDPDRLISIINALNEISKATQIILPLHPRTKKILKELGLTLSFEPINPLGYFDIIQLLKNCLLVMTDSGGMQKEASFFKKYCITLRDETEWVELVEGKANYLAGAETEKIIHNFLMLKEKPFLGISNLYGDGNASDRILSILK